MNNLLSYCGLVDTRISASEKDLPVHHAAEMVHHVVGRQIFAAEKWAIVSKDPN